MRVFIVLNRKCAIFFWFFFFLFFSFFHAYDLYRMISFGFHWIIGTNSTFRFRFDFFFVLCFWFWFFIGTDFGQFLFKFWIRFLEICYQITKPTFVSSVRCGSQWLTYQTQCRAGKFKFLNSKSSSKMSIHLLFCSEWSIKSDWNSAFFHFFQNQKNFIRCFFAIVFDRSIWFCKITFSFSTFCHFLFLLNIWGFCNVINIEKTGLSFNNLIWHKPILKSIRFSFA